MKRTKQPTRRKRTKPPVQQPPTHQPNGHFAKGNKLWKIAAERGIKVGVEPKFPKPEYLLQESMKYFEWEDNNLWEHEQLSGSYYGVPIRARMKRMVPYTIMGLCIFLGISEVTWKNYRDRGGEFLKVCRYIEQIIRQQKFQGASAGYFNHAIIARDLGLVDRKDLTTGGEKLPSHLEATVSIKEAEQKYKDLLKKGKE